MSKEPKAEKLKMCRGCENNFYNGNNPYGVKECWLLKSAKVVSKKQVSINDRPPWKQEPIKVLSCRKVKGFVFVDAKREY